MPAQPETRSSTGPVVRVKQLWQDYWTPGPAGRRTTQVEARTIYAAWLIAFVLKVLGSSWDVSWHFKWLRDDLAPPHLLNSAGTAIVIALVIFHTYTGYAVDQIALRFIQAGTAIFVLAVPIDLLNHAINGLDITAWSPSHGMLYLGTAVMLIGVIRGWWLCSGTEKLRTPVLIALWTFFYENVHFANTQQEYGIIGLRAWQAGAPEAEPSLLQFAADQINRPVDLVAVQNFTLPIPPWVHAGWIVTAGMLTLIIAAKTTRFRWTATSIAVVYLAYRSLIWPLLAAGGFPKSAVPYFLLAGAVLIDLVSLYRGSGLLRALIGSVVVTAAVYGAGWVQSRVGIIPPWTDAAVTDDSISPWSAAAAPYAAAALFVLWAGVELLVKTKGFARWQRPRGPKPRAKNRVTA